MSHSQEEAELLRQLNEVYADRNRVVLAFTALAWLRGWTVGWLLDNSAPEWGIVYVATPAGQVSWHYHRAREPQFEKLFPQFKGSWDGHTKGQASERITEVALSAAAKARLR